MTGAGYQQPVVDWIGGGNVLEVTAAVTLGPNDDRVYANIPAAGTYVIELAPVAERPWGKILVWVTVTGGGTSVTVADQSDGRLAFSPGGALTAINDYLLIENVAGEYYRIITEVST